jgi:hypothetical protein
MFRDSQTLLRAAIGAQPHPGQSTPDQVAKPDKSSFRAQFHVDANAVNRELDRLRECGI